MEVTTMTVNDIYKCSNIDDDTRFVIDTSYPETVYDGKWYDMEEGFKKAEINFFCIAKMDKKHGLPLNKKRNSREAKATRPYYIPCNRT